MSETLRDDRLAETQRVIRYNRSPESSRQRSEGQRNRRPIATNRRCDKCLQPFTPRVGNQKHCELCIVRKPR